MWKPLRVSHISTALLRRGSSHSTTRFCPTLFWSICGLDKRAKHTLTLTEEQQRECVGSPWDFDRIVLYLQEENSKRPKFNERLQHVAQEWEKLRASEGRRSLIPLHYSVRSILRFLERTEERSKEARPSLDFFREMENYLKARPEI